MDYTLEQNKNKNNIIFIIMKTLLTNAPTIVKSGLTLLGLAVTTNLVWTGLVGLYRSSMRRQIDLKETYASDIVRSYAVITGGANGCSNKNI